MTHGWTFSKSVLFVDVCKAIGEALDTQEKGTDWPVLISLECHVPLVHQDELVRIMVNCWGERLVQGEMEGGEILTPRQLRGRIVLMVCARCMSAMLTGPYVWCTISLQVEYYPDGVGIELDEDTELESEQDGLDRGTQVALDEEDNVYESLSTVDAAHPRPKIADSLANLGFYARSMKPPKEWWGQSAPFSISLEIVFTDDYNLTVFSSPPHPPHVILNVNERHLPTSPDILLVLLQHARHYLRRIYPRGTRLTSSNLDPWVQWRSGTHIACLNWQRWDEPMWLNEAMFAGTCGWIVRPNAESARKVARTKFVARVVGASAREYKVHRRGLSYLVSYAVPRPKGDQHDFVGYCHAELVHRDVRQIWQSDHVHGHSEAVPDATTASAKDVVHLAWDQTLEWIFDVDPLTFLLYVLPPLIHPFHLILSAQTQSRTPTRGTAGRGHGRVLCTDGPARNRVVSSAVVGYAGQICRGDVIVRICTRRLGPDGRLRTGGVGRSRC